MSQRNPLRNPKLNQDFFTNLPSEIIIDILSRLPVRTIISCKCVCKSWLHLLKTHEFVESHLSKSVPGLAVSMPFPSKLLKIFEFVDVLDLEDHDLHYNLVTNFNFPHHAWVEGSANGLLFLCDRSTMPYGLYICNPITRDYIQLNYPGGFAFPYHLEFTYGFGASKMTGQHKLVKIFHNFKRDRETLKLEKIPEAECRVYTVGTGSWRRLGPGAPLMYSWTHNGVFLNGNLHWLVYDLKGSSWISCFDLETELFSTFSLPLQGRPDRHLLSLFALGDCLCLCDSFSDYEIVIWLMKEYGVEKSWTREFVISKIQDFVDESYDVVCPIKVFKDGDILMALEGWLLAYYSNKTKTIEKVDMFGRQTLYSSAIVHTPSFLSLKSFQMENFNRR